MKDRAYEIALNPKYDRYQRGLPSVVYKFFDKKKKKELVAEVREELAQELHKPVIKKFKKRKIYAKFKDNIWPTDLDELGSLASKNWVLNIYCVW